MTAVGCWSIMTDQIGILLVNLGTPTAPTKKAISAYLAEFLADPKVVELPRLLWLPLLYCLVLPFRSKKLVHQYQSIWTEHGSPLLYLSQKLIDKIQSTLGEKYLVKLAMRYGEPSLKNALTSLKPCSSIIILPLYPQYSAATTATIFDKLAKILKSWRIIPELHFINQYYKYPLYIEALANKIQAHFVKHGYPDKLLFSFHSLPERSIHLGEPYAKQCHQTAELIAQALKLAPSLWQLTFQSRFGRMKWLMPYTDKTLIQLGQEGIQRVDVVCPGFAVDCLETLEEIAKTNQTFFIEAGGKELRYIPALNDDNEHVQALTSLLLGCLNQQKST